MGGRKMWGRKDQDLENSQGYVNGMSRLQFTPPCANLWDCLDSKSLVPLGWTIYGFLVLFPPPPFLRPADHLKHFLITWKEGEAGVSLSIWVIGIQEQCRKPPSSHSGHHKPHHIVAKGRSLESALPPVKQFLFIFPFGTEALLIITHPCWIEVNLFLQMERHIILFPATFKFYVVHLIGEHLRPFVKKSDRCSHCESHHHTKDSHPCVICHHGFLIPLAFKMKV